MAAFLRVAVKRKFFDILYSLSTADEWITTRAKIKHYRFEEVGSLQNSELINLNSQLG